MLHPCSTDVSDPSLQRLTLNGELTTDCSDTVVREVEDAERVAAIQPADLPDHVVRCIQIHKHGWKAVKPRHGVVGDVQSCQCDVGRRQARGVRQVSCTQRSKTKVNLAGVGKSACILLTLEGNRKRITHCRKDRALRGSRFEPEGSTVQRHPEIPSPPSSSPSSRCSPHLETTHRTPPEEAYDPASFSNPPNLCTLGSKGCPPFCSLPFYPAPKLTDAPRTSGVWGREPSLHGKYKFEVFVGCPVPLSFSYAY